MASRLVPDRVLQYVSGREIVSIDDLVSGLGISRLTAKNYLSRLVGMELARRIGRGLYQVGGEEAVGVELNPALSGLVDALRERFPMADFVVWSLSMLADYAHYALGRDLFFVEADRLISASVRDFLLEKGYHAVLKPDKRNFREYTFYSEKPVFVLEREEKYGVGGFVPTPERIWLDLYYLITRRELSFSAGELGTIFMNMLRREGVNFNRLLRYAQRRRLRDEMIVFLCSLRESYPGVIPEEVLAGRKGALEYIEEMVEGARE
ncbi:hypothetical protein AC482_04490 [miscellaneous Crenarchaeota group-15 archaeon DG-45]|uniref:Uncharacterized protein n=1 Tax=miscellaneous Crenarchaeota group-15 archaeon DG-45 TaxID=1685127 RepID=A0A0M0BPG4_9ARCH|nr:MAG: hypothetical protein AC482_04490 [miscellaneous Crenarchaeota group-15 archaeon DG-45]